MSSAPKKNVSIEIKRPKEALELCIDQHCEHYNAHLEAKIGSNVYQSRIFKLGSSTEAVLLRICLGEHTLPLTDHLSLNIKLFVHLPNRVLLFGVQDCRLGSTKFPYEQQFPMLAKADHTRVYNLTVVVQEQNSELPTIYLHQSPIGARKADQVPYLCDLLREKANTMITQGTDIKSPAHLAYGVALAIIKKTSNNFIMCNMFSHMISDEFNDFVLSRSSCYLNSPAVQPKDPKDKRVFVDFKNKRQLVFAASSNYSLPRMYFSGIVLLPNGNYIMTGGMTKDSTIIHRGLFYLNPRHNFYMKIAELPFNLNKHDMHYFRGYVLVNGGVDHKDDKSYSGNDSGQNSSNLNRFNLRTLQWMQGTMVHTIKTNIKVCSIIFANQLVVYKGTENLEVFDLNQLSGTTGKWVCYKIKGAPDEQSEAYTQLNLALPATFFQIEGTLYICHKKPQETAPNYSISKVILKTNPKGALLALFINIKDISLANIFSSHIFSEVNNGIRTDTVYFREASDVKQIVFKNGQFDEKASSEIAAKFENHFHSKISDVEIGDSSENAISGLQASLSCGKNRKIAAFPALLPESADPELKKIHEGEGHSLVPTNTNKVYLFNYFEKVAEDSYTFAQETKAIRELNSSDAKSVLPVPGSILDTTRHGVGYTNSGIFFVGGLIPSAGCSTYTKQQILNLEATPQDWTVSAKIIFYRQEFHYWKVIDYLPRGLFSPIVLVYRNQLIIAGGFTEDRKPNTSIYMFDLETFTIFDAKISLSLEVPDNKQIEACLIDDFVYFGFEGGEFCEVLIISELRTFTEKNPLFAVFRVHHTQPLEEDVSFKYRLLLHEHGTKNAYQLDTTLADLKSLLNKPKDDFTAAVSEKSTKCPEVDLVVGQTQQLLAVSTGDDDLFGLDQRTHTMTFSNHYSQNPFSLIVEDTHGKTREAVYNYSNDRVMWKSPNQTGGNKEKEGEGDQFTKGLIQIPFPYNATANSLPNGKVLIAGGEYASGGKLVATNKTWVYDPRQHTYTQGHKMRRLRVGHTTLSLGNYIYVFGGKSSTSGEMLSDCERYCAVTGEWEKIGSLPFPLSNAAACTLFNRIYIFGGEVPSGVCTANILVFNLQTLVFENPPLNSDLKMPTALKGHLAVSTSFNSCFVIGGEDSAGANMQAFSFEFDDGYYKCKLAKKSGVRTALYPHVGGKITIVDGQVLIVGGNPLHGCEALDLKSDCLKDLSGLRKSLSGTTEIYFNCLKNNFSIASNYLHSNPQFDKLYIFGLDQQKEIWR